MATFLSHTFDQASWRIIKEFVGIYGIKMDYTKIGKLSQKKLTEIYFKHAKLSQKPFKRSFQYDIKYDENGKMSAHVYRGYDVTTNKDRKALILKKSAQGYKNKKFYVELSKAIAISLK